MRPSQLKLLTTAFSAWILTAHCCKQKLFFVIAIFISLNVTFLEHFNCCSVLLYVISAPLCCWQSMQSNQTTITDRSSQTSHWDRTVLYLLKTDRTFCKWKSFDSFSLPSLSSSVASIYSNDTNLFDKEHKIIRLQLLWCYQIIARCLTTRFYGKELVIAWRSFMRNN